MDPNAPIPYIGLTPVEIAWALLVLIIGIIIVKIVVYVFKKSLRKAKLPAILVEFLARFLSAMLYIFVILAFVGALGFNVDSVVLGISAAMGIILAFGLQDSIMNMAAGFWIASIRPFNKNDVISTQGMTGKVSAVGIMSTEMLTPDNTYITIPNKLVWGSPMINYTKQKTRRVDINVGIAYGTDVNRAVKVAMNVMRSDPRILKDPTPSVFLTELADHSVNLQLRPWTKTDRYWDIKNDMAQKIYEAFNREGIEIPFPQVDVHLKKE